MSIPLRVLIVEDSQDDAVLLLRALRRGGYDVVTERVETAADMNAALDRAEWDAVLSDYTMPHFSALDALAVLKNRQLDIPFIIVSGTIGEETAVNAMKAGAQDFLTKASLARLVPALEREVREAHIRRERRRAEEALRQSEERFRQIAETIDEVFWIADPSLATILYVSPAYERVWGRSIASFNENPRSFLESIQSHDREQVRAVLESHRTGLPFDHEYRIMRPDGVVRWIWDRGFPVRDKTGQITHYVGVAIDITERKQAEEALRESEAGLAAAQRIAHIGSWHWNVQTDTARWSDETFRIFGLPPGQLEDHHRVFLEMIHPEDRNRVERALADALSGTGEYDLEYRIQLADGTQKVIHGQAEVLKDDAGVPLAMRGINHDVTDSKRAEAEKARLVAAIEQSAEAVMITNPAGNIEYVNPAFTRITGYCREEVLGQDPRVLKSDKHEPEFFQQLWATILRGETWSGELVNRRKDGSLYTEQMNIAPIRDGRGAITHFIAAKQDVTERKRLEDQLRQAQKMEAVGLLAGGVAHDFNNLLTVIISYSQMALDELKSNGPLQGYLKEINKAGDRAASLTRQLLAFSRKQLLAPRVLDLNSLVAEVEEMLRRLIGEDIDLALIRDSALGQVKADPGQMEQVLMNLAVNARDAMPQGGKLVIETANLELQDAHDYRFAVVPSGHYAMVAVRDTGIGMDASTQAHIFEPFFTTKEKGKGTGLGLAMVYGIVKQSGGYIWVESELGRGSTFKICLPRVEEAAESVLASETRGRPVSGSETILVVEDEEAVRALAARILKGLGYKVLESIGPEDALQIGARHKGPIDLLLTDVVLPRMSGRMVAEHLAILQPGMKALYMSGYTDDSAFRHGVLEASTAFLQKPFTLASLARKVREVLDAGRNASL